jgi:lactate racemase
MRRAASEDRVLYGEGAHALVLPRGRVTARLEPATMPAGEPGRQVIRRAIESPIGSPRLRDVARGKRSAAVLVPGKDRVAAAHMCLPLVLEELNAAGIPDDCVEVFLATGTHEKHTPEDAARVLGAEAVSRVRWHEHECRDDAALERVGTTSRGNEVFFSRRVLAADVKVLTGRIIPHYFAGFGGGRKALLPGVAGFKTIQGNHRLTLAAESGWHPGVRACRLDGNPVHLDMLESARLVPGTFVLNTLLDGEHNVVGAVAGELDAAHRAGCAAAEKMLKVTVAEPVDAAIASAGGAPYDCNFMQALKALFDVQEVVRPGGAILGAARCPGGMKKGFLRWGAVKADEELERGVRADYDLTGHNSILLRRLTRKARVALWSDLPDAEVRAVGVEPVHSLAEGLQWLLEMCPGDFRCAFAPLANITYASCP